MIDNPKIGNPGSMTRLDQGGDYPPVAEKQGPDMDMSGGGNSKLMNTGLDLVAGNYGESERTLVSRLPQSTKNMLGIRD